MNLKQILGGLVVVLSVLIGSTAQLQDLFGPTIAKSIVSAASILNAISGGWLTILTSQANTVRDASNTVGVEPLKINEKASPSVAAVAVNPNVDNVAPVPGQEVKLEAIAKGA